jgi:hypothetical protein
MAQSRLTIRTHESANSVFDTRKKDLLDRIDYLRGLVDRFNPDKPDRDTIRDLDYLLESLDNVIKDTKDATGLSG